MPIRSRRSARTIAHVALCIDVNKWLAPRPVAGARVWCLGQALISIKRLMRIKWLIYVKR